MTFVTSQACTVTVGRQSSHSQKHVSSLFLPNVGANAFALTAVTNPPVEAMRETYRGHTAYVYCAALMEGL